MPNQSGVWTLSQQFQARGQGLWPAPPGAPTIGTATAGNTTASVAFTAPTCTGYPAGVTSYTVTSTPGCITASGASSPISVTGLTNGTSYTFKVKALGSSGLFSPCSAASNSVTPALPQQNAYTVAGTYSFVVPSGLNPATVSVVAVGGGGAEAGGDTRNGGGGGELSYVNSISVSAGETLTVTVGAGSDGSGNGGQSSLKRSTTVLVSANGGARGCPTGRLGGAGGTGGVKSGGGSGGAGGGRPTGCCWAGGGGAGGYSGNGGRGSDGCSSTQTAGSGGGGGGGARRVSGAGQYLGGGGGVGILGAGSSGAAGVQGGTPAQAGGGGGSGGANGNATCTGYGGLYGGGSIGSGVPGGGGAVRIIYSYSGVTRSFPSTNTGDL